MNQFNPRTDPYIRAYQDAQDKAHELADKTKEPHLVIRIDPDEFQVQPESKALVPQKQIKYTAQPGTITYRLYKEQANAAHYSVMTLKEWAAEGRLSLDDYCHKHGIQTIAEKEAEKAAARAEAKRIAEGRKEAVNRRVKIAGKSNKGIVFQACLDGEYDLDALMKLTEGHVKIHTIKSWIMSWSRGTNFPAGCSGEIKPLNTNNKKKKGAKK
jgi:hypothetical protein